MAHQTKLSESRKATLQYLQDRVTGHQFNGEHVSDKGCEYADEGNCATHNMLDEALKYAYALAQAHNDVHPVPSLRQPLKRLREMCEVTHVAGSRPTHKET